MIGLALAPVIAAFYGEPRVAALFAVLACAFVVTALGTVPQVLLRRRMDFRATEFAAMAGAVAGAAAGIGLALGGAGAWAVIAQALVGTIVATAVVWVAARPRIRVPRVPPSRPPASLTSFGGDVLGSRLFFYLQRFADNLLVGAVLGAASLGAYSFAYSTMMEPFARIVDPVRAVLHPAMARVREQRERLTRLWVRGTRALIATLLPILITCAVMADEIVDVVLGDRWAAAADPLRVLALVGAAQALIALNSLVLTVLGETRRLLRFSALTCALSIVGFVAGLPFGITGVAAGYAVANLIILPRYMRLTASALGVSSSTLLRPLGGVAPVAALTAVGAVSVSLLAADATPAVRLAIVVTCAVAVATAVGRWAVPEVGRDAALLWRAGVRT